MSLPAALAVQTLAALISQDSSDTDNRDLSAEPDLGRVQTRVVVSPSPDASFVATGASVIEVPPWQHASTKDFFAERLRMLNCQAARLVRDMLGLKGGKQRRGFLANLSLRPTGTYINDFVP